MRVLAFLACAALASCAPKGESSRDLAGKASEAKALFANALKDPDSAEFRNVAAYRYTYAGKPVVFLCGEVNAKNSFGGYSGFERFITGDSVLMMESRQANFSAIWAKACADQIERVKL